MPTKNRLAISLPEGIGLASKFSKAPWRLVRAKNGSLQDGDLLLQLSLKELGVIRKLSREMNLPRPQPYDDSKTLYDDLKEELERLVAASQSTTWFSFFKRLEIKRETHDLVKRGYKLYFTVMSTSESLRRHLLSCNTEVEDVPEGDTLLDEQVKGIALVDMDDEDPSEDPIAPEHPDDQLTPQSTYNIFIGCVSADHSDTRVTMNNHSECA